MRIPSPRVNQSRVSSHVISRAANHSALRCLVVQSELSRPILAYAEGAHPLENVNVQNLQLLLV